MKNIFNFNLFKESFKQLRVVGIIFTAVFGIMGILSPLENYFEYKASITNEYYYSPQTFVYSALDTTLFMYLVFVLAAPIITLITFSFLTKRNSSDFYHSIPHKRSTIYGSYICAITAWLSIITFVPTILMSTLYKMFSSYISINIQQIFIASVNTFICSLFVIAAISIACSLTGTILNNIIISGIIIFLPRILMAVICSIIDSSIPFLLQFDAIPLFMPSTNMVFGSLLYVVGDSSYCNITAFGGYTIYTLAVTLIYLVIALLLFIHRKSEVAGNSSASTKVQSFARLCIGFIITLPIIEYFYSRFVADYEEYYNSTFFIIVDIAISFIAMFIYEFVSTKKIKKAIFSFMSAPVVLVADALFVGILIGLYNISIDYTPATSNVDYITINTQDDFDYFSNKLSTVNITDKELISLLSNQYKDNVEAFKSNKEKPGYTNNQIVVSFNEGIKTRTRIIFLSPKNFEAFSQLLIANSDVASVYTDYPDINSGNIAVYSQYLDAAKSKKVYDTLVKEIKANPNPIIEYYSNYPEDNILSISFDAYINNIQCSGIIPLLPEYRESLALFKKYLTLQYDDFNKITDSLSNVYDNVLNYDDIYYSFNLVDLTNGKNTYYSASFSNNFDYYNAVFTGADKEDIKNLKDELYVPSSKTIDAFNNVSEAMKNSKNATNYKALLYVQITLINNITGEDEIYTCVCPIADEFYSNTLDFLDNINSKDF